MGNELHEGGTVRANNNCCHHYLAVLLCVGACSGASNETHLDGGKGNESQAPQDLGGQSPDEFFGCDYDMGKTAPSDPCGSPGYLNVECLFFCGNEDAGAIEYFGTERAASDAGCDPDKLVRPRTPPGNSFYFQFCQKYCEGFVDEIPSPHDSDTKGDLTFDRDYRATKSSACVKSGGKLVGMYNASLACHPICSNIR